MKVYKVAYMNNKAKVTFEYTDFKKAQQHLFSLISRGIQASLKTSTI